MVEIFEFKYVVDKVVEVKLFIVADVATTGPTRFEGPKTVNVLTVKLLKLIGAITSNEVTEIYVDVIEVAEILLKRPDLAHNA